MIDLLLEHTGPDSVQIAVVFPAVPHVGEAIDFTDTDRNVNYLGTVQSVTYIEVDGDLTILVRFR